MIRIYGASDDLVEIEGDVSDEVSQLRWILIGDETRGVRVRMKYAATKTSDGVWEGRVEQVKEGVPMFPITIDEAEPGGHPDPRSYSVRINIDCPPGTPVHVGKRRLT